MVCWDRLSSDNIIWLQQPLSCWMNACICLMKTRYILDKTRYKRHNTISHANQLKPNQSQDILCLPQSYNEQYQPGQRQDTCTIQWPLSYWTALKAPTHDLWRLLSEFTWNQCEVHHLSCTSIIKNFLSGSYNNLIRVILQIYNEAIYDEAYKIIEKYVKVWRRSSHIGSHRSPFEVLRGQIHLWIVFHNTWQIMFGGFKSWPWHNTKGLYTLARTHIAQASNVWTWHVFTLVHMHMHA